MNEVADIEERIEELEERIEELEQGEIFHAKVFGSGQITIPENIRHKQNLKPEGDEGTVTVIVRPFQGG